MKVTLIKMPVYVQDNAQLDQCVIMSAGIYALAAVAREHGHDVVVCDPATWEETPGWADVLMDRLGHDADVVGFSAHSFNWAFTRDAVDVVKRVSPDTKVILGGVHPTHRPDHVMRVCTADFLIQGEAEESFPRFLDAIANNRDFTAIPGLAWRDRDSITVNPIQAAPDLTDRTHPLPAYDLVPAGAYQNISVETSRGCAGVCSFCSVRPRRQWTAFGVDESVQRIHRAEELGRGRFTSDTVYIADNCFTIDRKRAADICLRLTDEGLTGRITLKARVVDMMDSALLEAMARLRPAHLHLGVECGYDRGLRMVAKGTTTAEVVECAVLLERAGLARCTMFSFIVGLPWEDEQDCLTTMRFSARLAQEFGCQINTSLWTPVPSELWDRRAEYGIGCADDVFDRMGFLDPILRDVHPRITDEGHRRIRDTFAAYKSVGVPLRIRDS